jgi:hypothetical protein
MVAFFSMEAGRWQQKSVPRSNLMDMVYRIPEAFSEDFVQTRLASAGYYRAGDSGTIMRLVAGLGAGLEKAGAAAKRWAKGPGETKTVPHRVMRVR